MLKKFKERKDIVFFVQGILLCYFWMRKLVEVYEKENSYLTESCAYWESQFNRCMDKWNIMVSWRHLEQKGESVGSWLYGKGFRKVAIYGLGEIGELLVNELLKTEVELLYIVDKNKCGQTFNRLPILEMKDDLDAVDCMLVTTVKNFVTVQAELDKKGSFRLLTMGTLMKEMEKECR